MIRGRRWLPLVLLTGVLGAGAAEAPPPPEFDPDLPAAGKLVLAGQTWSLETAELSIQLRRLGDQERLNFIARSTGHAIDPFAGPPDQAPRYFTFLARIANRTESSVEFNPVHSWLATNRQQILYPLGIADVMSHYHEGGMELPQAYSRVAPALLEHPRSIAPGEELAGLLVYPAVDARTKSFRVDVELTRSSGDVVTFAAPYRRRKPPKD